MVLTTNVLIYKWEQVSKQNFYKIYLIVKICIMFTNIIKIDLKYIIVLNVNNVTKYNAYINYN